MLINAHILLRIISEISGCIHTCPRLISSRGFYGWQLSLYTPQPSPVNLHAWKLLKRHVSGFRLGGRWNLDTCQFIEMPTHPAAVCASPGPAAMSINCPDPDRRIAIRPWMLLPKLERVVRGKQSAFVC